MGTARNTGQVLYFVLIKKFAEGGERFSYDVRYFIRSLDPCVVPASEFQDLILRHWEVENCLHLQKGKFYGEDKHVFRRTGLGATWTVLTSMALSLSWLMRGGERTLRERFLANPLNALKSRET